MYKPDYGLKLLNDGVSKNIDITFSDFPLYSLTIIAKGQYSTMLNMPLDGDIYALSLDFNQKQLDEILNQTHSASKSIIELELLKDPLSARTIDFKDAIKFHAVARLGTLESNAQESYVPLILHEVLSDKKEVDSIHEKSDSKEEVTRDENLENIFNGSPQNILDNIEFDVSTQIENIIDELRNGKTDSLEKMSYIICGDPTDMKVYEIESFLLKEAISTLEESQLAILWLDIKDDNEYDFSSVEEIYDFMNEFDIYNHVSSNIDLYRESGYSQAVFINLLNQQCWLETKIQESKLFYRELEGEVLSKIEYFDSWSIIVPSFVSSFEEMRFFYIYGKGIEHLTFDEYKKHLLYKLCYFIAQEKIGEEFFSDINMSIECFEKYCDNSEFYKLLPPIYFAKKIIEADNFTHVFQEIENNIIYFTSLESSENIEILREYDDDNLNETINLVLNTNIYNIVNFESTIYNQSIYNNSDRRYDDDLSRFMQYKHSLEQHKDDETRLSIYNKLKAELEDEHNTVKDLIQEYLKSESFESETISKVEVKQENIEKISTFRLRDNFFIFTILHYIKNNFKSILQFSFWITLIVGYIGYSIQQNSLDNEEKRINKIKEEKVKQDINASIQQSVLKFNANTDWIAELNKGKSHYINNPILTYELERVWLTEKPILFTGKISDIKIKNKDEYTVTVSRDFYINKTNFTTDIELILTASKNDIDLFIKNHDAIDNHSLYKGIVVIAKINSVSSQYLLDSSNTKHEVKIGNGKMLDIQFIGYYRNMLDN